MNEKRNVKNIIGRCIYKNIYYYSNFTFTFYSIFGKDKISQKLKKLKK